MRTATASIFPRSSWQRRRSLRNADVLKAHIEGCVTSAIESGDEDLKAAKLAEIERVVDKLSK